MNMVYQKWVGTKYTVQPDVFQEILPFSKEKRYFLKIHNRSKTGFLKLAFSQAEADNDIYILVAPGGWYENLNVVPKNAILAAGDEEANDVIIYQMSMGE